MSNKRENIKSILSIISVSFFLIFMTCSVYLPKRLILLSSFAFLQNQKDFYIEDLSKGILLKDIIPVTDDIGLQYDPYQFRVVNNSDSKVVYQIVFSKNVTKTEINEKNILSNKYLKFSLNSLSNKLVEPTILPDDGIIYKASIDAHSQEIFEFRMWLDWDADNGAMNKIFAGKVEINKYS